MLREAGEARFGARLQAVITKLRETGWKPVHAHLSGADAAELEAERSALSDHRPDGSIATFDGVPIIVIAGLSVSSVSAVVEGQMGRRSVPV